MKRFEALTLKEAFPEFDRLHLMQSRLDKAGHTVQDWIEEMARKNILAMPEVFLRLGESAVIGYLSSLGSAYLIKLITQTYPV